MSDSSSNDRASGALISAGYATTQDALTATPDPALG